MGRPFYTFGSYRFETQSRLLFREDERISLTPKAADLLLVLLDHTGQLLAKDELLRLVWPETFVEEGNLSRLIFSLRKTLADNGEGRTYIETIPKRGYRFIGPLEEPSLPAHASIEYEERTREQLIIEQTGTLRPPISGLIAFIGALSLIVCVSIWIFRARRPSPGVSPRAILVLPLVNLTGNASDQYFSDGLTEELISAISESKGVRVVPRGTAFQFKGKAADVREVGRRLDVDAVLEGGVRRDPQQIRVNLRLIRVADGSTLWSHGFSRPAAATIGAQQEIARAVLQAVEPNAPLRPPERSPGTQNLEAYHSFLRARFAHQDQAGSLARALALYREAVRLDPEYADAWAGQAACRVTSGYLFEEPPQKAYEEAVVAAQHALSLDPKCASAHQVLANVKFLFHHDWAGARREFDTALELSPNNSDVLHARSHYWLAIGRPDLADEEGRRGLRIDPLNMMLGPHQAWVSLMTGQYDEAIRRADSILQFNPVHKPTLGYLLNAYEEAGQIPQAIEVQAKLGLPAAVIAEIRAAAASQGAAGYCRRLAGYFEQAHRRPTTAARLYAIAGDADNMIRMLDRGVAEHDSWVVYLTSDAVYAPYRADSRFRSLVRAVGLP